MFSFLLWWYLLIFLNKYRNSASLFLMLLSLATLHSPLVAEKLPWSFTLPSWYPSQPFSPSPTFVSPMDKREASWRTWFLYKAVGFIPSVPCTGYGEKPSFKRWKICLPVPQVLKMLTTRFSFSHRCDARGRGSSLGRTPPIRGFICQCALPDASPWQKQSRGMCMKKAASSDSCAPPAM